MKKKEINQNGDKPMYFEEIKGDVNVFTNAKTTQLTLDEIHLNNLKHIAHQRWHFQVLCLSL